MGRKRRDRRQEEHDHAKRRFRQRLHVYVTPEEVSRRIEAGESLERRRDSHRCDLHVLRIGERLEVFVYDHVRKTVVTVLPACDDRVVDARRRIDPNAGKRAG